MSVRAGVDTGGTFTDIVAVDETTQAMYIAKTLSTPEDPANAIFAAATSANISIESIASLIYGTTAATNALLERRGARVGLLATDGFRDLLAIQRTTRPDHFDLHWQKTDPLVERSLRRGVRERVLADGTVDVPLNEVHLRREVALLRDAGVDAIAVAYLFSFMNDVHERRTREVIAELAPAIEVSLSSQVLPKWGEFERTSTTVIDAYLRPLMKTHLSSLEVQCRERAIKQVLIMQSNGGALTAARAIDTPFQLIRSGPAGGVMAASHIGKLAGLSHVIAADMGGTSFEAAFLTECEPSFTTREELEYGIPIAHSMIDVRAIGAGGGSIARLDEANILKVGPKSAGADPGPACYGRGGIDATITDANVVLGRIPADLPLAGHIELSAAAAHDAVATLGTSLGMDPVRVAQGIIDVSVHNMAQALRLISVERGHDPRLATLIPYGGAGPLHACELARALQIDSILVPSHPGAFSALGALIADARLDYGQTSWMGPTSLDVDRANAIFHDLEQRAVGDFHREGFAEGPLLQRSVEMRYVGQNFELEVPMPAGALLLDDFVDAIDRFHREHDRLYGYAIRNERCEILTMNVTALCAHANVELPRLELATEPPEPISEARVRFAGLEGWFPSLVYDRATVGAGAVIEGPAIIVQLDATTLLDPGARAVTDEYGNMRVSLDRRR